MIIPARLYVTADQVLADQARTGTTDANQLARADAIAELASIVVEHVVGHAGTVAHLVGPEVVPAGAAEAARTVASDLWRRPSTPGGYFQVADYVGRLAADPASSVLALLAPYRESWAIA